MKKPIVSGSIAYDHLMRFDGHFPDAILPEKLQSLSVSFLASSHHLDFGGCAGNIAYGLSLLGQPSYVFGVMGEDNNKYFDRFSEMGLSTDYIGIDASSPTAAAYILTDNEERQITFFSPSAMNNTGLVMDFDELSPADVSIAIVSPDLPARMLSLSRSAASLGIPFIFDPGQQMSSLSRPELLEILEAATGVILNRYEFELLLKKLELDLSVLLGMIEFLVVTDGAEGCELHYEGTSLKFPVLDGLNVLDPTGSGDAFRSGFLYALTYSMGLPEACLYGNATASFAVESKGTQNYRFSPDLFNERLERQRNL